MARTFNGASQYLSRSAIITTVPVTMACSFKAVDTSNRTLLGLFQNAATGAYLALYLSGGFVVAEAFDGVSAVGSAAITGVSNGAWHVAAAVFTNNVSRTAYLDGVAGTPNTTSVNVDGLVTTTAIGVIVRTTPVFYMNGDIGEAAMWNVALSAGELTGLGRRWDPSIIRPQSLVAHWRLEGNQSPEPDAWKSGLDLTLTGAPTKSADHPPLIHRL